MQELFKPKSGSKVEATAQAFRSIVESEAAAREAKTVRLRAARLAHDAETKPAKAKAKSK